jgi:hypothetical protein
MKARAVGAEGSVERDGGVSGSGHDLSDEVTEITEDMIMELSAEGPGSGGGRAAPPPWPGARLT